MSTEIPFSRCRDEEVELPGEILLRHYYRPRELMEAVPIGVIVAAVIARIEYQLYAAELAPRDRPEAA